jgi:hypothetical protein
MAFFDFLNTPTKKVGKGLQFLVESAPGVGLYTGIKKANDKRKQWEIDKMPGGKQRDEAQKTLDTNKNQSPVTDFLVGTARSIARVPETYARSGGELLTNTIVKAQNIGDTPEEVQRRNDRLKSHDFGSGEVTDPVRKLLYGKEKVETLQTRTEGNKKVIEGSRFRDYSGPLSFLAAGATVAGDLPGSGAVKSLAKEGSEKVVQKLATEGSEEVIKKLLIKNLEKGSVDNAVISSAARALSKVSDAKIVPDILSKVGIDPTSLGKKAVKTSKTVTNSTPVPKVGEDVTVYSGHQGAGTPWSTPDKNFATIFANEDKSGNVVKGIVDEKKIKAEDIFDTRKPEHRKLFEEYMGRDRSNEMIQRSGIGLPNHAANGEEKAIIEAAKVNGYNQAAVSELDNTGKKVVSYVDTGAPTKAKAAKDEVFRPLRGAAEQAHMGANNSTGISLSDVNQPPGIDPTGRKVSRFSEKVSQDITNTDDYVKQSADGYYQSAKSNRGGFMADRTGAADPYGSGVTRMSEHDPFYRRFYKENNRKPSKADYEVEVRTQLEKGGGDLVPKDEADAWQVAKSRESDMNALAQTGGADTSKAPSIAPTGPKRQKQFLKTLQESDKSTPQLKEAVGSIEQQKYIQKQNSKLIADAQKSLDTDKATTYEGFLDADRFNDHDVAVGNLLLAEAQKAGDTAAEIRIATKLDQGLRESGRATQAASIWNRLTPEGTLLAAERKVRKAREDVSPGIFKKGFEDEAKTTTKLKTTIDNPDKLKKENVDDVISGIAKDLEKKIASGADEAPASVGEQVAKRVGNAVDPKKKKQADTLVQELTKKIKEESLPTSAKKPRSATEVLKEVFGRHPEAKEAYPEAQRILRDRFKDKPEALKVLDKFFDSELNLPAASKTIDRSIQEQLKENGAKISEIIHTSWADQKQSVDDIAKSLTKEGFDAPSAKMLAEEVVGRLNTGLKGAKIRELESLLKKAPKGAKKTFEEKIAKLSNIGALDDRDYLDLARAQLKLPNLTEQGASKISRLSQQAQGMPDGHEKFRILKEIQDEISKASPTSAATHIKELFNVPKAVMASFDFSGGGRQGSVLGARFPKVWAKAEKDQFKYFGSTEAFDKSMAKHATSPNVKYYDEWGIDWADPRKSFHEEAYAPNLAEKVPGLGRGVQASDRAYTGVLTDIRLGAADAIIDKFKKAGINLDDLTKSEKESMGKFINSATGRGGGKPGGKIEKWMPFLGDTLFSPRLWKSRIDMINPVYYAKLKGPARKLAIQTSGAYMGVAGVVLGLAVAAGAKVSTDPRSSDFLKIRIGDLRYDILGGLQQNIVLASRFATGEKADPNSGEVRKLEGGFGKDSRLDVIQQFLTNKANPTIGAGIRMLQGKTMTGEPVNPYTEIGKLFVPLSVMDMTKGALKEGPGGAAKVAPTFFGVSAQSYEVNINKKQKAYVENLEKRGAPKEEVTATKEFFKKFREAPDADAARDKIKKAMESNDRETAIKAANEYNKKYAKTFKTWSNQYGKKYSSGDLIEEYNKGKISSEDMKRMYNAMAKKKKNEKEGKVEL